MVSYQCSETAYISLLTVSELYFLSCYSSIKGKLNNLVNSPRSLSVGRLSGCIMKPISNSSGKNGGARIISPAVRQQVEQ